MDDPRLDLAVSAVTVKVVGELKAAFGPRHDLIQQQMMDLFERMDGLERRINTLEDQIKDLGHLGIEIQRGSTHTQVLAQHVWSEFMGGTATPAPPPPMPEAPRPKAVDEACAVPPGESPQVVRLPRYGATLVPEPGYDPAVVWPAFIESVNSPEGSSSRGIRGSRRPRRH